MADIDYFETGYDGYRDPAGARDGTAPRTAVPRLGALMNWAGALMSLGIMIGMGIWVVQLMIRDVSGVPVIEALEGPMRQPPADPGGTQAPHQGLAVNRIAEGEEAQPVPDRLVLAPPPVELQEVRFEPEVPEVPMPASQPGAAEVGPLDLQSETTALIDRLLREAQPGVAAPVPEASLDGTGAEPALSDGADGVAVLPASVPGIARSLRPAARPAGFVREASADGGAGTSAATEEIAVSTLPDGTRLVQLGAFDTAELAREEWERIASRFPDYFEDRPRVIEAADSGGQTFFRLRAAGFDDLAASRRFCAVLVAQGTACIPVTVR